MIDSKSKAELISKFENFFDGKLEYGGMDWIVNKLDILGKNPFTLSNILANALSSFRELENVGFPDKLNEQKLELIELHKKYSRSLMRKCFVKETSEQVETQVENKENISKKSNNTAWKASSIIFSGASVASAVCAFLFNPLIFGIASGILGICAGVSIYNASNKSNDSKQPGQVR